MDERERLLLAALVSLSESQRALAAALRAFGGGSVPAADPARAERASAEPTGGVTIYRHVGPVQREASTNRVYIEEAGEPQYLDALAALGGRVARLSFDMNATPRSDPAEVPPVLQALGDFLARWAADQVLAEATCVQDDDDLADNRKPSSPPPSDAPPPPPPPPPPPAPPAAAGAARSSAERRRKR